MVESSQKDRLSALGGLFDVQTPMVSRLEVRTRSARARRQGQGGSGEDMNASAL
jgi:hypothetical protein